MKKEEKKDLVQKAFEGYVELAQDENKILIDNCTFYEECKNNEGELGDILQIELFEMLINVFEKMDMRLIKMMKFM